MEIDPFFSEQNYCSVVFRSFTWYAKDVSHLTGRDFNGDNRHHDKVYNKPSPRLRKLVKSMKKKGCS